jgi:ATP/ADP translocase
MSETLFLAIFAIAQSVASIFMIKIVGSAVIETGERISWRAFACQIPVAFFLCLLSFAIGGVFFQNTAGGPITCLITAFLVGSYYANVRKSVNQTRKAR